MLKTIRIRVSEELHKELAEAARKAGMLREKYFVTMLITGHEYTNYQREKNNEQPSK
jgi:hypothetical protein